MGLYAHTGNCIPATFLHFIPSPSLPGAQQLLSLSQLTSVSPHVTLEIEGIMKALATATAHMAACWAVALEVPS